MRCANTWQYVMSVGLSLLMLQVCHAQAMPAALLVPITLRDDRGVTQQWVQPPARVISLLPSLTEIVCALGRCDRLVGVDRFSNWPASVQALPKLGGLDDAMIEPIVTLKPDVVLAAPSARVVGRLEALGLRVVVLDSQTHAQVRRSIDLLGRLLDAQVDSLRVLNDMDRSLNQAALRVPQGLKGQRVYFEVDSTPYGAGEASFVGETLARLGLSNIAPFEMGPFPRLNPEFVVRARPDIVMASRANLDDMARRPGWATLAALRKHRACGFEPARYELLVRPGPRLGEAANAMADCLVGLGAKP